MLYPLEHEGGWFGDANYRQSGGRLQKRDPKHDTKDLVRFVWSRVPRDYRLTSVDGHKGAWIMAPERSRFGGGMLDLRRMPRAELLNLARAHFGYKG